MTEPQRRRFSLRDGMILIFAIAIGLAATPYLLRSANAGNYGSNQTSLGRFRSCAAPPLVALTIASLGLALISPRPPLRRLFRLPGFLACITACFALLVVCPIEAVGAMHLLFKGSFSPGYNKFGPYVCILTGAETYPVGLMVAGAWLGMALNRRWRWHDLSDAIRQVIGVCWIAEAMAQWGNYL